MVTFDYTSAGLILTMAAMALFTGLISGAYPALLLSSYQPAKAFKGVRPPRKRGFTLRRALVVVQLALSVILVIGTGVVYTQLDFVRQSDVGYDRENVLMMRFNPQLGQTYDAFRSELKQHVGILGAARCSEPPTEVTFIMRGITWPGMESESGAAFAFLSIDADYLETMNISISKGRSFSEERLADTAQYMLNQKAVDVMQLESPIGHIFDQEDPNGTVIGVVEDFKHLPFTMEIEPMGLVYIPSFYRNLLVRLAPGDVSGAIEHLEQVWKQFAPDFPLEYRFLDEDFDSMYSVELRAGRTLACFVALALFISCLGLAGLASFAAEQRTREIGVRRVLGASISGVIAMMAREFVILTGVAVLIGWPIAYFAMDHWLEGFAYRTNISAGLFVMTGLAVLAIVLATVISQATRAARANPVETLRHE